MPRECEDCALTRPTFGLPAEGKKRWCAGCAKTHPGAQDIAHPPCEDCRLTRPSFGLPAEGKKRWCGGCAHDGALNLQSKRMCEDCALKVPNFGLPAEGKKRWCAGCARGHDGAINVRTKRAPALKRPRADADADGLQMLVNGARDLANILTRPGVPHAGAA